MGCLQLPAPPPLPFDPDQQRSGLGLELRSEPSSGLLQLRRAQLRGGHARPSGRLQAIVFVLCSTTSSYSTQLCKRDISILDAVPKPHGEPLAMTQQQLGSSPVHPARWTGSGGWRRGDAGVEAGTSCAEFSEQAVAWPSWRLLTMSERRAAMPESLVRAGRREVPPKRNAGLKPNKAPRLWVCVCFSESFVPTQHTQPPSTGIPVPAPHQYRGRKADALSAPAACTAQIHSCLAGFLIYDYAGAASADICC